jgi:hypothetical protein
MAGAALMQPRAGPGSPRPSSDRSFYVFLTVLGGIVVITVVAYVVFGFPEISAPVGPGE